MTTSPPDPKLLLAKHGLLAKKSFGQNFLREWSVHQAVVGALAPVVGDVVVELGAGLGTLTWFLAQTGASIVAVERDRELAPILSDALVHFGNVRVIEADAKQIDYGQYAPPSPGRLLVAGNIPYQLTSAIIFSLIAQRARISEVSLLVQREVAERIVATPDRHEYGLLSVVLGAIARPRIVRVVGRHAFHPAPKVESAVLAWRFLLSDIASPARDAALIEVTRSAFQKRRKTLRNALASYGVKGTDAMRDLAIDPGLRPENLRPEQFVSLAERLGRFAG